MKLTLHRPVSFSLRVVPGQVVDWNVFYARAHTLIRAAFALGVTVGCRIRDERTGFDFDWRFV